MSIQFCFNIIKFRSQIIKIGGVDIALNVFEVNRGALGAELLGGWVGGGAGNVNHFGRSSALPEVDAANHQQNNNNNNANHWPLGLFVWDHVGGA